MENLLRNRIQERLDTLRINPFEAARRIPAERAFINDLLIGKKTTIRANAIPRVAAALDCDPGYLMGTQDTPRKSAAPRQSTAAESMALAGIIEAGAWRSAARPGAAHVLPVAPDPRFPASSQAAFIIRGDHAEWLGAEDGSVIVGVIGDGCRDGDVVVIRRTRMADDGQEEEITLRRVDAGKLLLGAEDPSPLSTDAAEILARAVSSHKVF